MTPQKEPQAPKEPSEETQQKIMQLQTMEQQLQMILSQKQQFQGQMLEVETAQGELAKAKNAYKIVGGIMVQADPKSLSSELAEKQEMLKLRIQATDKQEKQLREKATKIQEEVMKAIGQQ